MASNKGDKQAAASALRAAYDYVTAVSNDGSVKKVVADGIVSSANITSALNLILGELGKAQGSHAQHVGS